MIEQGEKVSEFQTPFSSYDDFLMKYKTLIETTETTKITEIIKKIILANLNVIWDNLIDTICDMVKNDNYIKNKFSEDLLIAKIETIKTALKQIKFSSIEFHKKKAPTISCTSPDESEFEYTTSQSIIATLINDTLMEKHINTKNLHVQHYYEITSLGQPKFNL